MLSSYGDSASDGAGVTSNDRVRASVDHHIELGLVDAPRDRLCPAVVGSVDLNGVPGKTVAGGFAEAVDGARHGGVGPATDLRNSTGL